MQWWTAGAGWIRPREVTSPPDTEDFCFVGRIGPLGAKFDQTTQDSNDSLDRRGTYGTDHWIDAARMDRRLRIRGLSGNPAQED